MRKILVFIVCLLNTIVLNSQLIKETYFTIDIGEFNYFRERLLFKGKDGHPAIGGLSRENEKIEYTVFQLDENYQVVDQLSHELSTENVGIKCHQVLADGGVACSGYVEIDDTGRNTGYLLVLNSDGSEKFRYIYERVGVQNGSVEILFDVEVFSFIETSDGGFVFLQEETTSTYQGFASSVTEEVYLIKVNSNGNKVWSSLLDEDYITNQSRLVEIDEELYFHTSKGFNGVQLYKYRLSDGSYIDSVEMVPLLGGDGFNGFVMSPSYSILNGNLSFFNDGTEKIVSTDFQVLETRTDQLKPARWNGEKGVYGIRDNGHITVNFSINSEDEFNEVSEDVTITSSMPTPYQFLGMIDYQGKVLGLISSHWVSDSFVVLELSNTDTTISTGLQVESGLMGGKCYPNPSNGIFTVEECKRGFIKVFAADGRLVLSEKVEGNGNLELNLENESDGVYLLKYISEDGNEIIECLLKRN